MSKKILLEDWILLVLGGFIDFFNEIKDPFSLLGNYYKNVYGFVPLKFQKSYSYHTVWRSLKRKTIKKNEDKQFNITFTGLEKLKKKFPLLWVKNNRWDGLFRIVIYDIDEESRAIRDIFRRELKRLGFGMFQKSVWISPHNFISELKEFLIKNNLDKKVILIETKKFYIDDLKKLAKKLWSIDKLNQEYLELHNDLKNIISLNRFNDRDKILNKIKEKIIEFYFKDPFLPDEFLPDNWMRKKVVRLIKKLNIFD